MTTGIIILLLIILLGANFISYTYKKFSPPCESLDDYFNSAKSIKIKDLSNLHTVNAYKYKKSTDENNLNNFNIHEIISADDTKEGFTRRKRKETFKRKNNLPTKAIDDYLSALYKIDSTEKEDEKQSVTDYKNSHYKFNIEMEGVKTKNSVKKNKIDSATSEFSRNTHTDGYEVSDDGKM